MVIMIMLKLISVVYFRVFRESSIPILARLDILSDCRVVSISGDLEQMQVSSA